MQTPPADRSLSQRLFVLALLLVFVVVSVQYSRKVLTPRKDGLTQSAILRWSKQIQAMEGGENIHEKFNYPNPPVMAQILWPLSELAEASPFAGALAWFYLKVAMALVCMVWSFRLVEAPDRPFPAWAKALAVVLSIRPIVGDLTHGNVNIFILFLVMASLYAFSRGRDLLSGLLLALAIACKVTPALFIIYFLWKRGWRVLIGCGIGLVLFFILVPSLVFAIQKGSVIEGFEQNRLALTSWVDGMIVPYVVRGEVTPEKENQSLPGLLTRLLTHAPSFSGWVDDVYTPLAYHNVADLGPGTVKRIVQTAQLAFLVLMAAVCRAPIKADGSSPHQVRRGWRLAAEFSLILVAMLLFSERTWKHHCVTLLLPFAVLCYALPGGFPTWVRRTAWATVIVAGLLMLSTSSGVLGDEAPKVARDYEGLTVAVGSTAYVGAVESGMTARLGLVPDSPGKFAQVYGAYVGAFLALIGGLSVILVMTRKTTDG
ncbi:MAG TPA: glycosyltransferase family 87 protein [Gemmataceae bacterium]|nr:glycosyltransferase family 87 protein [Gemmataceae bacterium]